MIMIFAWWNLICQRNLRILEIMALFSPTYLFFHIYTNKDGGKLKKRKFGESEFDSIINKFEDKAQRIANWNPNDSLSPSFNVGDWCSNCDYQTTCPEYR